jgi:hypothetical protein
LSTSDYIYSKDQIDNKFYTQTYIDNNFLKNSENIYIDGLDEFKETEEDISLQEVLKKIQGKTLYLNAFKPDNFDEILEILQDICDNKKLYHLYV